MKHFHMVTQYPDHPENDDHFDCSSSKKHRSGPAVQPVFLNLLFLASAPCFYCGVCGSCGSCGFCCSCGPRGSCCACGSCSPCGSCCACFATFFAARLAARLAFLSSRFGSPSMRSSLRITRNHARRRITMAIQICGRWPVMKTIRSRSQSTKLFHPFFRDCPTSCPKDSAGASSYL